MLSIWQLFSSHSCWMGDSKCAPCLCTTAWTNLSLPSTAGILATFFSNRTSHLSLTCQTTSPTHQSTCHAHCALVVTAKRRARHFPLPQRVSECVLHPRILVITSNPPHIHSHSDCFSRKSLVCTKRHPAATHPRNFRPPFRRRFHANHSLFFLVVLFLSSFFLMFRYIIPDKSGSHRSFLILSSFFFFRKI